MTTNRKKLIFSLLLLFLLNTLLILLLTTGQKTEAGHPGTHANRPVAEAAPFPFKSLAFI